MTEASRRQTWTAYILFGAIILVFVLFGFKTVDGPALGYAAQVNSELISVTEFKRQFDQRLQYYSMMFGGQFTPKGPQLERLKADVLEELIGEKLVAQGAEQAGFRASDAQIRDQILSVPAFQKDGRFQRERYEGYLSQVRSSAGQFEKELKDSARVTSLRTIMTDVLKPSGLEVQKNKDLSSLRTNTEYVEIDTSDALKFPKVSDAEIADYLKQPEIEKQLKQKFDQSANRFETPEEIKASHILIRADSQNPASLGEAQKKVDEIARRAKTEDFGNLAAQVSEDPGSKARKGDLGYFSRGKMDPEFEKAAFEANPGVVVGPIKSSFGFHLIKVSDKKPPTKTPFEKAKLELAKEAAAEQKAEKLVAQLDEALKAQDTARVNKIVSESGLKWETTGPFDLNSQAIPKVGNVDEFMQKAFELTPQKPLADRIVRFASKAFVIRHKDPGPLQADKKDSKSAAQNEPDLSEQLARGRMSEVLSSWEKALLTSSKVSRNSAVLDQ